MVESLAGARVVVLGDIILDHYVSGQVEKFSLESSAPVLRTLHDDWRLGGAANVAANIASLGGEAVLLGVIGADPSGDIVQRLGASSPSIDMRLVVGPDALTTTKTRFLAPVHQLLRVDRERVHEPSQAELRALSDELASALRGAGVLVLSDYSKGVLSNPMIGAALAIAGELGVPTIVDPKRSDLTTYKGATYITPNRHELRQASELPVEDDADVTAAAVQIARATGARILVKRGPDGLALVVSNGATSFARTRSRAVFDVTGAGDTVVAVVAMALANGLDEATAMALANAAAGVVIQKTGTATCTPEELRERIARDGFEHDIQRRSSTQIATLADAVQARRQWAQEGLSVGFTNGCFDVVHAGHVKLLQAAAKACDRLIVALNDDASVARLKGDGRPVNTLANRASLIGEMKSVAMVVPFSDDTPILLIEQILPDVIIKGGDYREDQVVGGDVVRSRGGRVVLIDLLPEHSTTEILARIRGDEADG